jgi:hypothetical protein
MLYVKNVFSLSNQGNEIKNVKEGPPAIAENPFFLY